MIALCAAAAVLLTFDRKGRQESTERLKGVIGPQFVEAIQSAEAITAFKVLPGHHCGDDKKLGDNAASQKLDAALVKAVKSCLLNDEHYYFDMTKKCEFVPEIGFLIQGNRQSVVYASASSKQIKFIDGGHEFLVDCDPMTETVENIMRRALR